MIDGNRITSVVPHADANHAGRQVVDASNLTVMPGLIEFHSHLQKDFGEAAGPRLARVRDHDGAQSRATLRTKPVEDREANEAGVVRARASTAPAI